MKVRKVQIGARIPEHLLDGIKSLEESKNIGRTEAIITLLERGLYSTDNEESTITAARRLAKELTSHKREANEWKQKYTELASGEKVNINNHPFMKTMLSEGIEFSLPNRKVRVKTLNELFNFLNGTII